MPKWVGTLLETLLVVGFVLGAPLWIPTALAADAVGRHRLRKAAKAFACVSCGRILGADAIARADREWSEYVRELMRLYPGAKFRLVRTIHAICPTCGTRYTFIEKERTFVVNERRPPRLPG